MSIDFDSLQAHQGPKAVLAPSTQISEAGHSDAVQGFDGLESVYVEVAVSFVRARFGARGLTILLESSSNGSAWSTEHTFTFGADGVASTTVDTPADYLRLSWTVANQSEWWLLSAFASPPVINEAGGGGSLPAGGSTGEVLTKQSNADGDADWAAAGGSTPFTPTDLSALGLWLDASQIVGLSDGDPVATWADLSGNDFDAAQADSDAQPIYKTGILNSLPVVRFDASGMTKQRLVLSGAGLDLLRALDGFTIAAVTVNFSDGTNDYVFNASDNDVGSGYRRALLEIPLNAANFGPSNQDGSEGNTYGGYALLPASSMPLACIGTVDFARGGIAFQCSGFDPQSGSFAFGDSLGPTPDTSSEAIVIGGKQDESDCLNGDIAELIVYQRALNGQELRQVREYLCDKWGAL